MSKKPITVYWSPYIGDHLEPDWSFLYPSPVSVFSDHMKNKDHLSKNHLFQCPASASKIKKTLAFKCPMTFTYQYDYSDNNQFLELITDIGILLKPVERMLTTGPHFKSALGYSFFAEESLEVSFTSPFFHKVKYMNNASTIPGNFDIGQWYRPYSFEFQTWSNKGSITFIEDEPLFYTEFKTDRPIVLKRYQQTELLTKYSNTSLDNIRMFGLGQSLKSRYDRFKSIGMREKILTEINKNIIDEKPITLQ